MMGQQESYVKNGLVLWLDGIDKGNVSGSWVDKINGYEFAGRNSPTFGNDYVATSADGFRYLIGVGEFETPPTNVGTIEVCISDYSRQENQIIYMPSDVGSDSGNGKIAFGLYMGAGVIWSNGYNKQVLLTRDIFKIISVNDNGYMRDGVLSTDYWGSNNWGGRTSDTYIGRRNSGTAFTGKIHAIRIYNRQLSQSEMLHNQRIDNKRFNLGLTI